MACGSCSTGKDGKPGGCNGSCSGGCNRMNTFDWLADLDIEDAGDFDLVEVNFKKGARKDFFHNPRHTQTGTGDWVLVEVPGGGGYDVGFISLSGDLVRMQMKKKKVNDEQLFMNVIRRANDRDLEKHDEARSFERASMVKARAIARTLDLDMKIGDVEYQGDGRKATFYYTADGRVDFRELIRLFAKEFKVKVEMRQIGARQESSRVGGIGSCGRELCCSTWLSDFKSVSTVAARYQNLAFNQSKLSGACGRLKCCLNYELDTYLDALVHFPEHADRLQTVSGTAVLIKTDVFKGVMTYVMDTGTEKGKFYSIGIAEVKSIQEMNKKGEKPADFKELQVQPLAAKRDDDDPEVAYEDVIGAVELREDKRKKSNSGNNKIKKKPSDRNPNADRNPNNPPTNRSAATNPNQTPRTDRPSNQPPRTDRPSNPNNQSLRPEKPNNQGPRPERDNNQQPRQDRPNNQNPRTVNPNNQGPKPDRPNNQGPRPDRPNNPNQRPHRPNNPNQNNPNRNKGNGNNPDGNKDGGGGESDNKD